MKSQNESQDSRSCILILAVFAPYPHEGVFQVATLVTPETNASMSATTVSTNNTIPETAPSSELLLASASASIVVPADARSIPKRRRKAEPAPELQDTLERLRQQLEQERRMHAIQRATAEQARRVADCLMVCQDTLLAHLTQPCFTLDCRGVILNWNSAMARWTARPTAIALGVPLVDLVGQETGEQLERACRLAIAAIESTEGSQDTHVFSLPGPLRFAESEAARLTLIPHCRIPGCVESFLVLVTLPPR
jgi:PAS domain-containing protein